MLILNTHTLLKLTKQTCVEETVHHSNDNDMQQLQIQYSIISYFVWRIVIIHIRFSGTQRIHSGTSPVQQQLAARDLQQVPAASTV